MVFNCLNQVLTIYRPEIFKKHIKWTDQLIGIGFIVKIHINSCVFRSSCSQAMWLYMVLNTQLYHLMFVCDCSFLSQWCRRWMKSCTTWHHQKSYELVGLVITMFKNHINSYGFWAWLSKHLWIPMVFDHLRSCRISSTACRKHNRLHPGVTRYWVSGRDSWP